jgi:hypothetical protein
MAGSIKIQHGATASTPQAGFTTLWSSTSGNLYYTKPNGNATVIGGLPMKNIVWGGTAGWVRATDPFGNLSNYYDVVFAAAFASTSYTADFYQEPGATGSSGINGLYADSAVGVSIVTFTNKTTAGIRVWNSFNGLSIPQYGTLQDVWNVKAIAIGEG